VQVRARAARCLCLLYTRPQDCHFTCLRLFDSWTRRPGRGDNNVDFSILANAVAMDGAGAGAMLCVLATLSFISGPSGGAGRMLPCACDTNQGRHVFVSYVCAATRVCAWFFLCVAPRVSSRGALNMHCAVRKAEWSITLDLSGAITWVSAVAGSP
jgi:hypothetical protein